MQPRLTQRRLRYMAFARKFCETMDTAQAYRDVFRPMTNPKDSDKIHGDKLLKIKFVQDRIGEIITPAVKALGVDQTFVIRRLLETIDGDITDYTKVVPGAAGDAADLMSLKEMREALPLSKRRLVKKYKVIYDQFGQVKSREIELEPKQPAMELLAKIRGWVSGDKTILINGEEMMRRIEQARAAAVDRSEAIRGEFKKTATYTQLQRPETVEKLRLEGPKADVDKTPPSDGK